MKYRKKPVVIDAMQFTGSYRSAAAINDELGSTASFQPSEFGGDVGVLVIHTLEGEMIGSPGDYIIKGVKGEFYPCKPDIFDATYESLDWPAEPTTGVQ